MSCLVNSLNYDAPRKACGRFTVADVMLASVVGQYGRAIKFDCSPWPNVDAWVQLTTRRPAFYPPRDMKVNPLKD